MRKLSKNIRTIIKVLNKHKVEYIVVGGVGSILQGADIFTKDIDVCPENNKENFERLSAALKELGGRLRGAQNVEVPITPDLLKNMQIGTWVTRYGDFDIIHDIPAGENGALYKYKDLYVNHDDVPVFGIVVHVASLKDIVASKRFAGRPKDIAVLPELEELLKQQEQEQQQDNDD